MNYSAGAIAVFLGCSVFFCKPLSAETAWVEAGTIVRATLDAKPSTKWKPGTVVTGETASPVFGCRGLLIAERTRVQLVVEHVEKVSGSGTGFWKKVGAISGFAAPLPPAPLRVIVRTAELSLPVSGAKPVDLQVVEVHRPAVVRTPDSKSALRERRPAAVALEVKTRFSVDLPTTSALSTADEQFVVPAGTRARVMLMSHLSASSNREGDAVAVRVIEPVTVNGRLAMPAGATITGKIARRKAPRRLRRPASLGFNFQQLSGLGGQQPVDIAATLSGAEADRTASRMDEEGTVTAQTSWKRAGLDLAISYVSGKVVDDLLEEGVKAIWGATASGSAATAARYVGIGVGLGFFLAQHGPDVALPRYADLELTFTRPFVAPPAPECGE